MQSIRRNKKNKYHSFIFKTFCRFLSKKLLVCIFYKKEKIKKRYLFGDSFIPDFEPFQCDTFEVLTLFWKRLLYVPFLIVQTAYPLQ